MTTVLGRTATPILHFLGGAFGEGLDQKIRDGYTRISHLYEHGDQVFLFGFSRGAYTARSLARNDRDLRSAHAAHR